MDNVLLERRGHVGILTLNRPKAYNALNVPLLRDIADAADHVNDDSDIRVLLITGAGRAFGAGADIAAMRNMTRNEAERFAREGHKAFKKVDDLYKPVIAAINGYALGGGLELALCCDIRLAGESAKLGQPEVSIGITPGFGGTQRLPRVIGVAAAMQLTLTARQISAQKAKEIRLVNEVYPDDQLMDKAMEMASIIASNAPLAVHNCKFAMSRRIDRFLENDLEYEAGVFSECFDTHDQRMAMSAFLEKKPREEFQGK